MELLRCFLALELLCFSTNESFDEPPVVRLWMDPGRSGFLGDVHMSWGSRKSLQRISSQKLGECLRSWGTPLTLSTFKAWTLPLSFPLWSCFVWLRAVVFSCLLVFGQEIGFTT